MGVGPCVVVPLYEDDSYSAHLFQIPAGVVFWSCSGGLHVQDSGVWWLQTEYITVQSFIPLSTLQVLVMGFVWLHIDACYVRYLSHLILKQGAERDELHLKTTLFSASNIERLQGANWAIVLSSCPSSFLPHNAFSFFSRYLFGFFPFYHPFPLLSFTVYSHLGTVKPAVQVAGEILYACIKHSAQWETAGMYFGAGLMDLGSSGWTLSCLLSEEKKYCVRVVLLPPSEEAAWSSVSGVEQLQKKGARL